MKKSKLKVSPALALEIATLSADKLASKLMEQHAVVVKAAEAVVKKRGKVEFVAEGGDPEDGVSVEYHHKHGGTMSDIITGLFKKDGKVVVKLHEGGDITLNDLDTFGMISLAKELTLLGGK